MSTWAYEYGTLWAIDLKERSPPAVEPRTPAAFREVSREDLHVLAGSMGMTDTDPLLRRLSGRRRCFAAWIGEDIAAYGWVSQGDEWIGEQERCIRISRQEAYIWDCVTLPDYRRQRLYSALLSHMLSVLKCEDTQKVWIGTALENKPSIKGFTNAGFRPVLELLFLRLFNLRIWWLQSSAHHSTRQVPEHLVEAAHEALVRPEERTLGPLVIGRSAAASFSGCIQVEG